MKKHLFLLIISYTCTIYCQESSKELTSIVETYQTKYKVPAVAASVIFTDSIIYATSGVKNIDAKVNIDLRTKFHLGSNTKAITSTLAANLIEQGILSWDTKLVDVIPGLKNHIRSEYIATSLSQLLSHRAHIQPFEDDKSREWRNIPQNIGSAENQRLEFTKYALNLVPAHIQKGNHIYSNGGYIIAATMLEQASQKTWEELLKNYFDQLAIEHFIGFPSQEENANAAYGHRKKGKSYKSISPNDEYALDTYFAPAGNLSMNLVDLTKFIQLHLAGLMGIDNYLTSKTYKKLHFGFPSYAFGWYNGNIGDTKQRFSYHAGSLGTFSSAIMLSADRKVAIVILVNADNKNVNELKNELRTELWEKYGAKQ